MSEDGGGRGPWVVRSFGMIAVLIGAIAMLALGWLGLLALWSSGSARTGLSVVVGTQIDGDGDPTMVLNGCIEARIGSVAVVEHDTGEVVFEAKLAAEGRPRTWLEISDRPDADYDKVLHEPLDEQAVYEYMGVRTPRDTSLGGYVSSFRVSALAEGVVALAVRQEGEASVESETEFFDPRGCPDVG